MPFRQYKSWQRRQHSHSKNISLFSKLVDLGRIRDGLILSSAGLYFCGYMVWMFLSWGLNLGSMPILDAQYFLAGIPISLALFLIHLCIKYYRNKILGLSEHIRIIILKILFGTFLFIFVFGGLFLFINDFINIVTHDALVKYLADHFLIITFSGIIFSILLSIFMFRQLTLFHVVQGIFGIVYYTFVIINAYQDIPAQLGGAKPRLAQIDVESYNLSSQTLFDLGIDNTGQNVYRTSTIRILFEGTNVLTISIPDTTKTLADEIKYNLDKDIIHAIHWK